MRSSLVSRRDPPVLDLVLLTVGVTAVSTSAPLIRAATAPAMALAFWRTLLALPVTGTLALTRHRGELRRVDGAVRRRSMVAGVLLAAHFGTWIPSVSFTSVASSVALVSTTPVWTALIAKWRGEPVSAASWRGIVIAFIGVLMLSGVDLSVAPKALFGDVLALVGGALAAGYFVLGADARKQASTATYSTVCYAVAAVVLLGVCVVGSQAVVGYSGGTWLAIAGMTIGPQLLGHTLLNRVVHTTSPTVVAVALLGEILGAAVLAWLFFDELPPATALPAALLIMAGVVIVIRAGRSPEVATEPSP